jgi:hypothetical protein
MGQRVLSSTKPWKRQRSPDLLAQLQAAGAGGSVAEFPPVQAFDDEEFELRPASDWLAPLEVVRVAAVAASEAEAAAVVAQEAAEAAATAEPQAEPEPEVGAAATEDGAADGSAPEDGAPPAVPPPTASELQAEAEMAAQLAESARAAADQAAIERKVLAQYVRLGEGGVSLVPCEVLSHDALRNEYGVALKNGHTGQVATVPRVLLAFDGEDGAVFVDRFLAALTARDAAVQELQYRLCIKDMPVAKKGEVALPLDKIDRVLQWTFNTDALKNGDVDTSQLLVEVYTDYVFTVNKLIFDSRRCDPENASEFESVQPPEAQVKPVPLQGTKVIPEHPLLQPASVKSFARTTCLGKRRSQRSRLCDPRSNLENSCFQGALKSFTPGPRSRPNACAWSSCEPSKPIQAGSWRSSISRRPKRRRWRSFRFPSGAM